MERLKGESLTMRLPVEEEVELAFLSGGMATQNFHLGDESILTAARSNISLRVWRG